MRISKSIRKKLVQERLKDGMDTTLLSFYENNCEKNTTSAFLSY